MQQTTDKFAFPVPPRLLGIEGVQPLSLEVAEVSDLGPRMRCIRLAGAGPNFSHKAGQDVMLVLGGGERPLSRRYTIRGYDQQRDLLELNLVTHGIHGPGAHWAASTRPGDRINGVGPRGKIHLDPDADWHLFLGDDSAIAATLSMLEAIAGRKPGMAFLEVHAAEDEVAFEGGHSLTWLHRGEIPAWSSNLLVEAMNSAELPAGRGHVYVNGEVQVVNAVQRAALGRGLATGQVSPKAYWGRGKA